MSKIMYPYFFNKVVVNIFNKNKELKNIINEYHDNVLDLIEFDTHKREVYDKTRGDLNQLILWFRLYDVYKIY